MAADGTKTSSKTGTLYFGYGSNLSPFQMAGRCPSSGVPMAIAKLNSWAWIIAERGYANVVPMLPAKTSLDTDANTVWGVVYNLTVDDEERLDVTEGSKEIYRGPENPIIEQRLWKPHLQGQMTYNKMYLPVKIEKWLISDPKTVLGISEEEYKSSILRTLFYVDENHCQPARIVPSYVPRMARAARECIALGVPETYVNNMFRQHGIDQDHPDSFTQVVFPEADKELPPKKDWEIVRLQFLQEELEP